MANNITATIDFYFKGKHFTPSVTLILDDLMQQHGCTPDLHQMLAKLHNIDSYSYEYEIMLTEDVQFSDAKGLAISYLNEGTFDFAGFEQKWHELQLFNTLAPMIKQQLEIDDIDQHPKFKSIIIAAYQAGKNK
ncbi:MAG: hypothetical protein COA63_002550 [Methylophaga sp.]|nr:hypothetical protein [Methylophaga sp.]